MIVALAGGVGGAKLAFGLNRILPPGDLTVIVNTSDDFTHLGLHVSPDVDTVTYTLAGLANPELGWGLANETWGFMEMLERLGGPTWFRLGDHDLATNMTRTTRLAAGETLTQITDDISRRLGVSCAVLPMSNDRVQTTVHTEGGDLAFQDYFVRLRAEPKVTGFDFAGAVSAHATREVLAAFADPRLDLIVFCPSNPFVSIAPILSLRDISDALAKSSAFKIAVSPIVGGAAIKGPAAHMMRDLGLDVSVLGIARHYKDLIDGLIIDESDRHLLPNIHSLGLKAMALPTIMKNDDDRISLARSVVKAGLQWASGS
jgi:LPPG:FO 2-phospho-L-lactate transferase